MNEAAVKAQGSQQATLPANIIKTREDAEPYRFNEQDEKFKFPEGKEPSWAVSGKEVTREQLRQRIEPWLTSLFQSDHLSLLAGSGLTHAIHRVATGENAAGMSKANLGDFNEKVDAAALDSSKKAGRADGNIEDQLRTAYELLRGYEILGKDKSEALSILLENTMEEFSQSILESERNLALNINLRKKTEAKILENKTEPEITINEKDLRQKAFNTLVTFLMSFASRTGVRDRLNIFTTNYDRFIEAGAELAGIHLLDRFVGNLFPIFRSSRLDLDMHYNPPGIRGEPRYLEGVVRYTKLHGSVDWVQVGSDIRRIGLPFGAKSVTPYLQVSGLSEVNSHKLMIYPNAAKDQETANYPYVELFRDFAAASCRPNSTLVTYGYGFGDDHINRVIRDMLTIPSTHLVVIAYGDELERIMKFYEASGRDSQITLLIGPELADIEKLTKYYLPKSAIDKAMSRMSDLLKQRMPMDKKADSQNISEVSFL